jgi:hypothetical protein
LFLNISPTPTSSTPLDRLEADVPDRAAERFAMLRELADIGMEMARALQGEVRARAEVVEDDAADPSRSVAELGLAFSRVSRAVRQTLALEARLEDDRLARERAAEDAQSQSNSELSEAGARVKAKLMRLLYPEREDDDSWDDDEDEDLSDGPDVERGEGFVSDRPAANVVAGVCGDLGIEPDLSLWADEHGVAVSAARAASDGQPVPPEEHREAATRPPPHSDEARGRPP